jgi:glyoxylase-like metal-dependent hydrolase (beta-lactamase superfamily II)
MALQFFDDDIIDLTRDDGKKWQYYWGDKCEIVSRDANRIRVIVHGHFGKIDEGFVSPKTNFRDTGLVRLSMVDVQQGDGLILETPTGKIVTIDGGENAMFARHFAARFRGSTAANPVVVDAMIVTHGDADHFGGLSELLKSETDPRPGKPVFVAPLRYYHNGMVKRPSSFAETKQLGATTVKDGRTYITGLVDDISGVPVAERNKFFKEWTQTLDAWEPRVQAVSGGPIERRRIDQTMTGAFGFLAPEGITVDVLGPISVPTANGPGLEFLGTPPDDAGLLNGLKPGTKRGALSSSHTINGHSVAFRLRFGNVRFMFTGDMNQESMERLRTALPDASLRSEILKTPHHGSADFDMEFLREVGPVVSLISSGDENETKEYIHPRATLMAALGRASRTTPSVIFCTELAAFFEYRGPMPDPKKPGRNFYAFERTNYGIAHVRTDGTRVLAFTHSGSKGMNEAYRFTVSATGDIVFASGVTKARAPKLP